MVGGEQARRGEHVAAVDHDLGVGQHAARATPVGGQAGDDGVHRTGIGMPEDPAGEHDQPDAAGSGSTRPVRRLGAQVPAEGDRCGGLAEGQRVVAGVQALGRGGGAEVADAGGDAEVTLDRAPAGRHADGLAAERGLLGVRIRHAVDVGGRPADVEDDDARHVGARPQPRQHRHPLEDGVRRDRPHPLAQPRVRRQPRAPDDVLQEDLADRRPGRLGGQPADVGQHVVGLAHRQPAVPQHRRHLVPHRGVAGQHHRDGPVRAASAFALNRSTESSPPSVPPTSRTTSGATSASSVSAPSSSRPAATCTTRAPADSAARCPASALISCS